MVDNMINFVSWDVKCVCKEIIIEMYLFQMDRPLVFPVIVRSQEEEERLLVILNELARCRWNNSDPIIEHVQTVNEKIHTAIQLGHRPLRNHIARIEALQRTLPKLRESMEELIRANYDNPQNLTYERFVTLFLRMYLDKEIAKRATRAMNPSIRRTQVFANDSTLRKISIARSFIGKRDFTKEFMDSFPFLWERRVVRDGQHVIERVGR